MKTEDLIQLGALAVIAYLAWQKFGKPKTQDSVDFGVANPNDSTWGDRPAPAATNASQGISFVQALLGDVL